MVLHLQSIQWSVSLRRPGVCKAAFAYAWRRWLKLALYVQCKGVPSQQYMITSVVSIFIKASTIEASQANIDARLRVLADAIDDG